MNIFDNPGANAGFGTLAFAAIGTVVIVAGFKFRWLRAKSTVILVGLFVLLVTVNSGGILGEIAGALRHGMNAGGAAAVHGVSGAAVTPHVPRTAITPVSAGGALVGLCGIAWYGVKLFAAKDRAKDRKEMIIGLGVGVCYGTGLGFTGYFVAGAVLAANNVGLWAFGG
ncbi:hypothetical protein ACFY0R_11855 [Streptomyces sp. NPDC001633]|uniref:hypothetical protein n=1 Tax=Streptomyces sp. NPDC001633 TaxID=3364595 RepID=UPI0036CFF9FB